MNPPTLFVSCFQQESTGFVEDIDTDEAWNDESLFRSAVIYADPSFEERLAGSAYHWVMMYAEAYPELLIERTLGGL